MSIPHKHKNPFFFCFHTYINRQTDKRTLDLIGNEHKPKQQQKQTKHFFQKQYISLCLTYNVMFYFLQIQFFDIISKWHFRCGCVERVI